MEIRRATPDDAAALLSIYRPYVENTAVSFEQVVPTEEEFARRIEATIRTHEWLVIQASDALCGYAYATPHRSREAYKFSVETSVYVRTENQQQGIGRRLYEALFASLSSFDFRNAYAAIGLPNDDSIALHKSLGFQHIGIFREVGFKQDVWWDVSWWQRPIVPN